MVDPSRVAQMLDLKLVRVPSEQITPEKWDEWCNSHNMISLGPQGRRAWIEKLSTYLRGADFLLYRDNELIDICYLEELSTP